MLCYAMVCYEIWTKTPPHTEEFHTFRSEIIRSQSLPQNYYANIYFFQIKTFKTELKKCCMLCSGMLWYDKTNAILWDCMLWYEIPMLCYEISMLCYEISMLCYAMVYVVKDMLEPTVSGKDRFRGQHYNSF